MKSLLLSTIFLVCFSYAKAQAFFISSNKRTDTTIWKIKNKSKNGIWGNSTYLAPAISYSKSTEVEISFGRTKGIITDFGRGIGYVNTASWGVSYVYLTNVPNNNQLGKVFIEYSHFLSLLLGVFVLRGEYILNFSNKDQYLRPSAGLTFNYFDILYNYSFKLSNNTAINDLKHGITLRAKLFVKSANWERNYFIKNRRID